MNRLSHPRSVLREAIVALLCALMLLSGLVQARALAAKASGTHEFALCLPEGGTNGQNDHDCSDCRLTPVGTLPLPQALAEARIPHSLALWRAFVTFSFEASSFLRPYLRGPPTQA